MDVNAYPNYRTGKLAYLIWNVMIYTFFNKVIVYKTDSNN
jgi:hypothetical protein